MEVNLGESIAEDQSRPVAQSIKEQVSQSHDIIFEKELSSRLFIISQKSNQISQISDAMFGTIWTHFPIDWRILEKKIVPLDCLRLGTVLNVEIY